MYVSVWVWDERSQKGSAERACQSEVGYRQPHLEPKGSGSAPRIPGQSLPYALPIVLSTAGTTAGTTTNKGSDWPCTGSRKGVCIDITSVTCEGAATLSGKCPGPATERCCPEPGSPRYAAAPKFELEHYDLTLPRTAVFGDVVHTLRVRDLSSPPLFMQWGIMSRLCVRTWQAVTAQEAHTLMFKAKLMIHLCFITCTVSGDRWH